MTTRIFFFGTPEIAVPALQALATDDSFEIVGVATPPNRPVGRKQVLTPSPIKMVATELGLPVHDVTNKTEVKKVYDENKFDLAVVIAFGVIFPEEVLNRVPTLNVHFSLLPRWRGASPVQSAILAGDEVSGVTVQKMVATLDAGPIVWQHSEEISNRTTSQLWSDWANLTARELPKVLHNFDEKNIVPQDECAATHCGKFSKSDGEIFPNSESLEQIWQKFCAFDPWPGIWLQTHRGVVKILKCSLKKTLGSIPLRCADGEIFLDKIQLAGKSPASAADVLRGIPDLLDR